MIFKTPIATAVFPIRVDCEERLINLGIVLASINKHYLMSVRVLEADIKPNTELHMLLSKYPRINYTFVPDTNPVFHRTKYLNMLIKQSKTSVVILWDTDTIMPIDNLYLGIRLCSEGFCLVSPYATHEFWNLKSVKDSSKFAATLNFNDLSNDPADYDIAELATSPSYGGCVIINKELYKQAGLENEHCRGWGFEDRERIARVIRLGFKYAKLDGRIFHLKHPRGLNSGGDHRHYLNTQAEWDKAEKLLTYHELKEYVNSWEWAK